jgi:predicted glycoside hydrolase/deacetylase ChbG (UPF0249 family)
MSFRLILNADDYGYDPAVSKGIAESMRRGVVSSTTMIVNSPHSEAAANDAEGLAIGLHLNLVRFHAVSAPGRELNETDVLDARFVAAETHAQLDRLRALLGRDATHLDVHKHAHLAPAVLEGLCAAAKERGLAVRSITPEMRAQIRAFDVRTNDVFLGDAGKEAHWTPQQWRSTLAAAPREGVVELMCHPGYRPSHLTSGYSAQREIELATFVADDARAALEAHHLTLSSWAGV